jgi:molybdopterin synthase sulfur carrier subunit
MIRVVVPAHLRALAGLERELTVTVEGPATIAAILDALEATYPALRGTIRDQTTKERRAFIRFFACEEDLSHQPLHTPLPDPVTAGEEPLYIIGAIAGGRRAKLPLPQGWAAVDNATRAS